jgi:hypothetical protein
MFGRPGRDLARRAQGLGVDIERDRPALIGLGKVAMPFQFWTLLVMFLPHRARIVTPTSIVQLGYDTLPLPKPEPTTGQVWARFVLISDTHGKTFPVPDGDVLLHSGDLTRSGTLSDLRHMMAWLCALPHPIKMFA